MAGEPIEELLGRRVREMRSCAGLTQAGLAERAGLAFETISRVERGKARPSIGLVAQLASVFGVSLARLLDFDQEAIPADLAPDLRRLVILLADQPAQTRALALELVNTLVEHRSSS